MSCSRKPCPIMRFLLVFVASITLGSAEQFSYEGFKVLRVHIENGNQLQTLRDLNDNSTIQFWPFGLFTKKSIDVMVKPDAMNSFGWFLFHNRLKHEILIENVEDIILKERIDQLRAPRLPRGRISFTRFPRHRQMNEYLDQLVKDHPDIAQVESAGKSYEDRDMKVIKLSTNPNASRPIIFIDAGIHPHEWLAPLEALFIINKIVKNPAERILLDKVDWHILPMVNPDGYEYTHIFNRLWRKTRSKQKECFGVDLNRNFGYKWGTNGGTSQECSFGYMGPKPFSEIEGRVLANYIIKYKKNIKLYVSLHCSGHRLLYPWSYTFGAPPNYKELESLADSAAKVIREAKGARYTINIAGNELDATSGTSEDWVRGEAGIELTYRIKMAPDGVIGFNPSPSMITKTVDGAFAGIKAFHSYVEKKFG